jgi:hypothetical protein
LSCIDAASFSRDLARICTLRYIKNWENYPQTQKYVANTSILRYSLNSNLLQYKYFLLQVYCGHEYTLSNYRFALSVDPGNEDLIAANARAVALRSEGVPTVPSTLFDEFKTNPFLRAESLMSAGEDYAAFLNRMRAAKNSFK